jgi:hypothetical protein
VVPMSILGNYSVFKTEPRNKWMCMEAHWKVILEYDRVRSIPEKK